LTGGSGGVAPGRLRGTRTRSAPGRMLHTTGVGSDTASPSTPTGTRAVSAVTVTSCAVSMVRPPDRLPRSSRTASLALLTVTPTTPSTPPSSRTRRFSPAMSALP
jgi:hypothetical protein